MVQKGLGWLLRETAKANPERTVPYLKSIRERAPTTGSTDSLRDAARNYSEEDSGGVIVLCFLLPYLRIFYDPRVHHAPNRDYLPDAVCDDRFFHVALFCSECPA